MCIRDRHAMYLVFVRLYSLCSLAILLVFLAVQLSGLKYVAIKLSWVELTWQAPTVQSLRIFQVLCASVFFGDILFDTCQFHSHSCRPPTQQHIVTHRLINFSPPCSIYWAYILDAGVRWKLHITLALICSWAIPGWCCCVVCEGQNMAVRLDPP